MVHPETQAILRNIFLFKLNKTLICSFSSYVDKVRRFQRFPSFPHMAKMLQQAGINVYIWKERTKFILYA